MIDSSPWPAYLGLGAGEVAARAETALRLLGPGRCGVCPRLCKVDRLGGQRHGTPPIASPTARKDALSTGRALRADAAAA